MAGPPPRSLCQVVPGTGLGGCPRPAGLAGATAPILHPTQEGTVTPWHRLGDPDLLHQAEGAGTPTPAAPPGTGAVGAHWGSPGHACAPLVVTLISLSLQGPARSPPGGCRAPRDSSCAGARACTPRYGPAALGGCGAGGGTPALPCPGQGPRRWGRGSAPSAPAPPHPALPHRSARPQVSPRSAPTGDSSPAALRPDRSHRHRHRHRAAGAVGQSRGSPLTKAAPAQRRGRGTARPHPRRRRARPRAHRHPARLTAPGRPRSPPRARQRGPAEDGRHFYVTRFRLVSSCCP